MTRRRLLTEVDARELAEWQAVERIEGPLGSRLDWFLAGTQIAESKNQWRRAGQKHLTAIDVLPRIDTWDEEMPDPEDMDDEDKHLAAETVWNKLKGIFTSLGPSNPQKPV